MIQSDDNNLKLGRYLLDSRPVRIQGTEFSRAAATADDGSRAVVVLCKRDSVIAREILADRLAALEKLSLDGMPQLLESGEAQSVNWCAFSADAETLEGSPLSAVIESEGPHNWSKLKSLIDASLAIASALESANWPAPHGWDWLSRTQSGAWTVTPLHSGFWKSRMSERSWTFAVRDAMLGAALGRAPEVGDNPLWEVVADAPSSFESFARRLGQNDPVSGFASARVALTAFENPVRSRGWYRRVSLGVAGAFILAFAVGLWVDMGTKAKVEVVLRSDKDVFWKRDALLKLKAAHPALVYGLSELGDNLKEFSDECVTTINTWQTAAELQAAKNASASMTTTQLDQMTSSCVTLLSRSEPFKTSDTEVIALRKKIELLAAVSNAESILQLPTASVEDVARVVKSLGDSSGGISNSELLQRLRKNYDLLRWKRVPNPPSPPERVALAELVKEVDRYLAPDVLDTQVGNSNRGFKEEAMQRKIGAQTAQVSAEVVKLQQAVTIALGTNKSPAGAVAYVRTFLQDHKQPEALTSVEPLLDEIDRYLKSSFESAKNVSGMAAVLNDWQDLQRANPDLLKARALELAEPLYLKALLVEVWDAVKKRDGARLIPNQTQLDALRPEWRDEVVLCYGSFERNLQTAKSNYDFKGRYHLCRALGFTGQVVTPQILYMPGVNTLYAELTYNGRGRMPDNIIGDDWIATLVMKGTAPEEKAGERGRLLTFPEFSEAYLVQGQGLYLPIGLTFSVLARPDYWTDPEPTFGRVDVTITSAPKLDFHDEEGVVVLRIR